MNGHSDLVRRSPIVLRSDSRRVIARPFLPGHELPSEGISRAEAVVQRLVSMPEADVEKTLAATLSAHSARHADLPASFRSTSSSSRTASRPASGSPRTGRTSSVPTRVRHRGGGTLQPVHRRPPGPGQPRARRPSLRHDGPRRRRGTFSSLSSEADPFSRRRRATRRGGTRLTTGRVTQSTTSTEFLREALDEDGDAVTAQSVLGRLPEHFTPRELEDVLASSELDSPRRRGPGGLLERIRSMAASSYELTFASTSDLSERWSSRALRQRATASRTLAWCDSSTRMTASGTTPRTRRTTDPASRLTC